MNCMLVILSKSLEEGEAEVSCAGMSDLLEQLEYPFHQGVGLLPLSLVPLSWPTIEITATVTKLKFICSSWCFAGSGSWHDMPKTWTTLTGVVFILKDCFTFYFTFSIQVCFHFSWQVSLLNLITRIVSGYLISFPPKSSSTRSSCYYDTCSKNLSPNHTYGWS